MALEPLGKDAVLFISLLLVVVCLATSLLIPSRKKIISGRVARLSKGRKTAVWLSSLGAVLFAVALFSVFAVPLLTGKASYPMKDEMFYLLVPLFLIVASTGSLLELRKSSRMIDEIYRAPYPYPGPAASGTTAAYTGVRVSRAPGVASAGGGVSSTSQATARVEVVQPAPSGERTSAQPATLEQSPPSYIRLRCPSCGGEILLPREEAHGLITCPGCGAEGRIGGVSR
ncbi:MAG: hypothetical protein J7L61_03840 [Thermoplasmata archaeon]|nr:hypothetical protein [Thermoplasmata archaeon]